MAKKNSSGQRKSAKKAGSINAPKKNVSRRDSGADQSTAKPKHGSPPGEPNVSAGAVKNIEHGGQNHRHEDLQQRNEELSRINSQLASKVEELQAKYADLKKLVSTVDTTAIWMDVANRTWSALAAVRAEEALHDSKQRLAAELSAMTRLHDLVARLLICPDLRTAMEEVLVASIEITGADLGHVQLFDAQTRTLEIVAQRGFDQFYLDQFRSVSNDHNSESGRAMWEGERIVVADVLSDPLYAPHRELAARAGYRSVQSTPLLSRDGKLLGILSTHYRAPFRPSERDLRVLDLYAQQAADFIERIGIEVKLHELNQSLEVQVRQRTEMLMILQDITRAANEARTVETAMYAALMRIEEYNGWQVGHVWRLAEDGSGQFTSSGIWRVSEKAPQVLAKWNEFRSICQQLRYSPGEGLVGAVVQTGQPQWMDDIAVSADPRSGFLKALQLHATIAFPITVNDDVIAVMEFFSDHPAKRDERFMEIMPDVGIQLGHVIERKRLEKLIADATEQEQRRLGSDIHDGVGQELTGLRYMAGTHADVLAEQSSPEAEIAQRIAEGLGTVQKGLRSIISDLVPVELDEKGLVAALRSLAERIAYSQDIECEFECDPAVAIEDASLATHMYRIGQEAVNNAVKHARARRITIMLIQEDGELTMCIMDDGIGMKRKAESQRGVGLRSMAFRAGLIGARLDIHPGEFGGTIVECRVRLSNGIPTDGKRPVRGRMNGE